jgi:uncharacterized protein HemX
MRKNIKLILTAVIALAIGLGAGYYYGNLRGLTKGKTAGIEQGKQELLAKQKKAEEEMLKKIREAANPFNKEVKVNPFSKTYKNPFAK